MANELTPDEHRWCDWVKEREAAGVRPDVSVHSESVHAFTTGASRARARVRRELLEAIEGNTERIEGGVCSQPGQCSLPEHVLTVVPVEDLLAALDRICPEKGE